jgi:hypothetical protein
MHDDTNELTAAERMMLAALPREIPPGDMLEERVVRALRRDGRFGTASRGRSWMTVVWRAAAAVALFAGGVATGRFLLQPDAPRTANSAIAPVDVRSQPEVTPSPDTRATPASRNGTVVAQTEMWL